VARFQFRLQGVLNINEKIENQKKQEYGLARAVVEREIQKKQALLDEREMQIDEFRRHIDGGISPQDSKVYNNYIEFLKEEAIRQDKVILDAKIIAEEKRKELVEAMKERKKLEKLRERQYEEFLNEQKLAEQRIVDEVVSYRFDNK